MRVAIMQPTYLPWIGYFALMASVDVFVLLDSVQFARRSWQQRNRIKTANGVQWLTVPVLKKGRRDQKIVDVEIDTSSGFPEKHIKAIETAYKNAPFYTACSEELFDILNHNQKWLAQLDVELIIWLKKMFAIEAEILRSSEMETRGSKAELLAGICEQLGAEEYISPLGSKEYMDRSDAFSKRKIAVNYFEYNHPVYSQLHGSFEPYMSSIDLLFNMGSQSREVLKS